VYQAVPVSFIRASPALRLRGFALLNPSYALHSSPDEGAGYN
jgi:hypothetical protein